MILPSWIIEYILLSSDFVLHFSNQQNRAETRLKFQLSSSCPRFLSKISRKTITVWFCLSYYISPTWAHYFYGVSWAETADFGVLEKMLNLECHHFSFLSEQSLPGILCLFRVRRWDENENQEDSYFILFTSLFKK